MNRVKKDEEGKDKKVNEQEATEEMRANGELLSLFMRHSPVYSYIKSVTPTESRIVQASDDYQRMLGGTGLDIVGKTLDELFPPEFAAKMTADDWTVVRNGSVLQTEKELDGRSYLSIKFPFMQGERHMLAGYMLDITERRRVEESVKKREQIFKGTLEAGEARLQAAEEKLRESRGALQEVEARLRESEDRAQRLDEDIFGGEEKLRELNGKVAEGEGKLKELDERIGAGRETLQELQTAKEELREAEEKRQAVEANLREGEGKLQEVEARLRESEDRAQRLDEDISGREEKLRVAEEKRQTVEAKLRGSEGKLKELDERIGAGRETLQDLQSAEEKLREAEEKRQSAEGKARESEARLRDIEGKVQANGNRMKESDEELRDIGEKTRKAEAGLNAIEDKYSAKEAALLSLEGKEYLLGEFQNNVRNNMSSIIALMEIQRMAQEKAPGKLLGRPGMTDAAFSILQNRVKAIVLLHELVYQSQNPSRIDFQGYLAALVLHLRDSLGVPAEIICSVDASGIALKLDIAVAVGLIVNELVTNAFKHAFPKNQPQFGADTCRITVSLEKRNSEYTLAVEDNGTGLPRMSALSGTKALGIRLVKMLGVDQLGGKLRVSRAKGTRFVLKFNVKE